MALGYDRIVGRILVESLGEKIHKGVLTLVYSVHFDIVAIDRVIRLSNTLELYQHIIGNHAVKDAVFVVVGPSVNLCTAVYDYLRDLWVVGKGGFVDSSE